MAPPALPPDQLRALAAKYRALVDLRARRDGGADPASAEVKAELRALAAQYPGCLRELDTLGAAELDRRARAAHDAADGAATEPWMSWIWHYHALMRAALAVRRSVRDDAAATHLDPAVIDPAFVEEVRRPPGGRIGPVVLRRLAALFGIPAARIAAELFPTRRPSPYTLG